MPRRLSIIALFAAWLCASGAILDVVQVVAWAKMFSQYAVAMPLADAAIETMDPNKPCTICMAVRRARDESKQQQPATIARDVEKLLLVFHQTEPVVIACDLEVWPDTVVGTPDPRKEPVPVPPPRNCGANLVT